MEGQLVLLTRSLAFVEAARGKHAESTVISALGHVARGLCGLQVHAVSTLSQSTTSSESLEVPNPAMAPVRAVLSAVDTVLTRFLDEVPNYFGVFDVDEYVCDLQLLAARLEDIVTTMGDPLTSSSATGLGDVLLRLKPTAEADADGSVDGATGGGSGGGVTSGAGDEVGSRLRTSTGGRVSCLLADVWWSQRFGAARGAVPWAVFVSAFVADHGEQHPGNRMLLHHRLCCGTDAEDSDKRLHEGVDANACLPDGDGGAHGSKGDTASATVVRVSSYDRFTADCMSFHEAYQRLVYPGTCVYVCGRVGCQQPRQPSLKFRVCRGLLGIGIVSVSCGGQHACALSSDGYLYSWGRGTFGRLGHGNDEDVEEPQLIHALEKISVKQVACGFAYTAAVSQDGELYAWGAGESGRLGTGSSADHPLPCKIDVEGKPVDRVYAGSVHTCVVVNGQVYSCGRREYTGHGASEDVLSPRVLEAFEGVRVVQVSIGPGGYHTIVLTAKGEVYTWGHNRVGQLGLDACVTGGETFRPRPVRVEALQTTEILQVVAGWGHSAVVTKSGKILMCGRNHQAQLGMGPPSEFPKNERNHHYLGSFSETPLPSDVRIREVGCGGEHTTAIAENGDFFVFGHNSRNQLGLELPEDQVIYPRLMTQLALLRRPALHVACGNDSTIVLAGPYRPPRLTELCLEALVEMPEFVSSFVSLGLPSHTSHALREKLRVYGVLLPADPSSPKSDQ